MLTINPMISSSIDTVDFAARGIRVSDVHTPVCRGNALCNIVPSLQHNPLPQRRVPGQVDVLLIIPHRLSIPNIAAQIRWITCFVE